MKTSLPVSLQQNPMRSPRNDTDIQWKDLISFTTVLRNKNKNIQSYSKIFCHNIFSKNRQCKKQQNPKNTFSITVKYNMSGFLFSFKIHRNKRKIQELNTTAIVKYGQRDRNIGLCFTCIISIQQADIL